MDLDRASREPLISAAERGAPPASGAPAAARGRAFERGAAAIRGRPRAAADDDERVALAGAAAAAAARADDRVADAGSDTDRWESEREQEERRNRFVPPSAELSDAERWINSKDGGETDDAAAGAVAAGASPSAVVGEVADLRLGGGSGARARAANGRAALLADTSRRPNPWELSNKKTFKPIITIGKGGDGGARSVFHRRRQSLGLPFQRQREAVDGTGTGAGARDTSAARSPLFTAAELDGSVLSAFRCGTSCIGAAIDVKDVYNHYQSAGLQCTAYKDGLNVVVHCLHHDADEDSDSHAFYFMYGCVVLWNFEARAEARLIQEARELFSRGTLEEPEVDDFGYVYDASTVDAKPHIHKDVIHLTTTDVMEKLAVAFGLAQSAKLSVFERTTESTIANTRAIPEQLAQSGKISLSRKEISMRVGQLFVDRSQVNLHSDMLDTPDFFWEDDEWEPLYQRTAKYMEVEKRVSVLNHRLDIIADLFDMLASEMHAKHASNLEIIIIVLIMIEVIFQVLELMQSWL